MCTLILPFPPLLPSLSSLFFSLSLSLPPSPSPSLVLLPIKHNIRILFHNCLSATTSVDLLDIDISPIDLSGDTSVSSTSVVFLSSCLCNCAFVFPSPSLLPSNWSLPPFLLGPHPSCHGPQQLVPFVPLTVPSLQNSRKTAKTIESGEGSGVASGTRHYPPVA